MKIGRTHIFLPIFLFLLLLLLLLTAGAAPVLRHYYPFSQNALELKLYVMGEVNNFWVEVHFLLLPIASHTIASLIVNRTTRCIAAPMQRDAIQRDAMRRVVYIVNQPLVLFIINLYRYNSTKQHDSYFSKDLLCRIFLPYSQ